LPSWAFVAARPRVDFSAGNSAPDRRSGHNGPSKVTPNHLPNSAEFDIAFQTLWSGARRRIVFQWYRSWYSCNPQVAYYQHRATVGNHLVACFQTNSLPPAAPRSRGCAIVGRRTIQKARLSCSVLREFFRRLEAGVGIERISRKRTLVTQNCSRADAAADMKRHSASQIHRSRNSGGGQSACHFATTRIENEPAPSCLHSQRHPPSAARLAA